MNIGIPTAILTSALVNLSITPARLTSRAGKDKNPEHACAGFAPLNEHKYSHGNTDIYAYEPQH